MLHQRLRGHLRQPRPDLLHLVQVTCLECRLGLRIKPLSLTDLVRTAQSEHADLTGGSTFYRQMVAPPPAWFGEAGEFEHQLAGTLVSEVMTEEVVAVAPDTPISLVVKKVLEHRIHRVLVIDESREYDHLAGIISLFDLVKLLE